ncbi:hypothetical protein GCM10027059_36450 [Myceligenerans halotolerans]
MLWHLATAIDDIDTGVNLIVRGTDKIDATSIQERLRALLAPGHQVAYLFLPRLTAATGAPKIRVRNVLSDAIGPEALRWFHAETYLLGDEPATTFDQIVRRLRPNLPKSRDSLLDVRRFIALNRKTAAMPRAGNSAAAPAQAVRLSRPAVPPS